MWDALRLDVRYSFRSLRRAPTFSLIVIVTLALAVGAMTAVGSLLNALVFRTLPVPSPEQLVALSGDEIGQHIRIAAPDGRDVEVIGVVADAPYVKLDDPTPLVVFRPIMQETARTQFPMAYVRAQGDLAMVRDGYTRVIKSVGH